MAKQIINIGVEANDGTGDSLRTGAFKINQNFDELYSAIGNGVNSISQGEGIAITNSFGQVVITNSLPNRGSFKSFEVAGQDTISTNQLEDSLTLIAGDNVTLITDLDQKSITIAVNSINFDNFSGSFDGSFTGEFEGSFLGEINGDVISTNVDTSLLKITGNSGQALVYYQSLTQQRQTLLNDIDTLNNQLVSLQSDLEDAQNSLAYWQSQPNSSEKTEAISVLNAEIILLESQINGVQTQISNKTNDETNLTLLINLFEPTLDTPYVSFTYDTTTLICTSDRTLSIPKLIINDFSFPTEDGAAGQALVTDGTGLLYWDSILKNLSITNSNLNSIVSPQTLGKFISIESTESAANLADGYVQLSYNASNGSGSISSTFKTGPTGIELFVGSSTVNYYQNRIEYNNSFSIDSPQENTVEASSTGIIFTSTTPTVKTLKLLVLTTCDQETQSSEIIVAKNESTVVCSVYGVVYTSENTLCEFDAQWNSIDSVIEVTATNLNPTVISYHTVQATELSNN